VAGAGAGAGAGTKGVDAGTFRIRVDAARFGAALTAGANVAGPAAVAVVAGAPVASMGFICTRKTSFALILVESRSVASITSGAGGNPPAIMMKESVLHSSSEATRPTSVQYVAVGSSESKNVDLGERTRIFILSLQRLVSRILLQRASESYIKKKMCIKPKLCPKGVAPLLTHTKK
jgi:hypothetical protein